MRTYAPSFLLLSFVTVACGLPEGPAPLPLGPARIDSLGARLETADGSVRLGLSAHGRGGSVSATPGAVPERHGAEVRADHAPGLVEWWRDAPGGIEHGVTLSERPKGAGPLLLDLALTGATAADADGDIALCGADGAPVATYTGLLVLDADGHRVPARMFAHAGDIRIEVSDGEARYPLVVDPVFATLEARLENASGPVSGDRVASAVALDGAGEFAYLGAPLGDRGAVVDHGYVEVWRRTGAAWTLGPVTSDTPGVGYGEAIAISGNGRWLLVGVPGAGAGEVRAFERVGATDFQARGMLTRAGGTVGDRFGGTIAVDDAGLYAVVAAPNAGVESAGAASFFSRSGSTWTALGATVTGSRESYFGAAVAMSGDGTRAVIGAPAYSSGAPLVVVYQRTGATFVEETRLSPSVDPTDTEFGRAVAISADGLTIAVGITNGRRSGPDEIRIFTRGATTWTETAVLEAAGDFNAALAMSDAGDVIAAGAPDLVQVFARTGAAWAEAPSIAPAAADMSFGFGTTLAMSADGSRLLVGIPRAPVMLRFERGAAEVHTIERLRANGAACDEARQCASAACADGLCCNEACGGGLTTDCEACSVAAGGSMDGTCTPLTDPGSVECRPAGGDCDIADTCLAGDRVCPDARRTDECRTIAGPCDVAEVCDGVTDDCPADAFATAIECRAARGACDLAEVCLGDIADCPPDRVLEAGAVCRASTDLMCDPLEACDGVSAACPADMNACMRDASGVDAGMVPDGGTVPAPASGCTCRIAPSDDRAGLAWAASLALLAWAVSRRRSSGPRR